jgi:hypothetical protein
MPPSSSLNPTASSAREGRAGAVLDRLWTSPWPTFLAVVAIDLLLVAVYLRPFLTAPGALVYGDLAAVYTYGGVQERWILTASVYQAVEQAAAGLAPWPTVQNGLYVATFVLPSIGIYWFVELFTRHKPLAGVVAVVLGTVLNPVFYGDLIQGGQEYGLWLLFTFLGLRFLCQSLLHDNRRLWEPAVGGVLFGLASSQSFGQTGMATGAVLLTGPTVLGILAYDWVRSRGGPAGRRALAGIGLFLAAYAALLTPLLFADLTQANGVLATASQTAALSAKTFGNIAYTFRPYGAAAALFAVPPSPTPTGYTAPLSIGWAAVVLLSLAGGMIGCLVQRGVRRWLSAIFLGSFLGFALYIVGLSSGGLLPLYAGVPPLDLLDGPDLLVYAEYTSLPFLLVVFFDWTLSPSARAWAERLRIWWRSRATPSRSRSVQRWSVDRPSPSRAGQRVVAVAVVAVLVILVLGSAYPVLGDLEGRVDTNPSVAPDLPYAPSSALGAIRAWYDGAAPTLRGFVLPLPDDGHGYGAVQGVIPLSELWVVPLYANDLVAGYNTTAYVEVMGSLANGSVTAWATQIGIAGVEYVVLSPLEASVAIAPSYLPGAPGPVNFTELKGWLDGSPELSVVYQGAGVSIYSDRAFVASGQVAAGAAAFSAAPPRATVAAVPALPAGGFQQWNIWPPSRSHVEPNGSVLLNVNYSASPDYVVLWAPLTAENNTTGTGGNVSLDPLYHRTNFQFADVVEIPTDARLQAYVAWYNTSHPASLFTWFAETDLSVTGSGADTVVGNLTPPVGTAGARVVYTAFPNAPGTDTDLLAQPPVASATVTTLNLSEDVSADVATASALATDGVLAPGSMELVYPIGLAPGGGTVPAPDEISLAPADTFDPWSQRDFSVPLVPANFPDLFQGDQGGRIWLEVSGYSNTSGSVSNATWALGGSRSTQPITAGPFSAVWAVPAGLLGQTGRLSFRGNATLSLIVVAVTNLSASDPPASGVPLNLPIGSETFTVTSAGPELGGRSSPELGSSSAVVPTDAIPIPAAAAVVAIALVGPRLGRRRATDGGPKGVSRDEPAGISDAARPD